MFLASAIAFIAGLACGSFLSVLPLTIFLLLALTGIVLVVMEARGTVTLNQGLVLYGALLIGVLWWTVSLGGTNESRLLELAGREPVSMVATVVEPVQQGPHRSVMVVSVTRVGEGALAKAVESRVRVTWRHPDRAFGVGDRVGVTARLRPPRGVLNPGGFDYEAYLKRRYIQAVASVSGPGAITLVRSGLMQLRTAPWRLIDKWRGRIHSAAVATLEGEALGTYLGIIIGERGYFKPTLRDSFMTTGTVHILSISGSHLGLIAFLSFFLVKHGCLRLPAGWLLSLSRWITPSRLAAVLTIFPVTFYALLAGGEVATIRALVMILVFLLAAWLGREKHLLHALAAAALLILIYDPQALWDISFQLSFVSVLAIALLIRWQAVREPSDNDIATTPRENAQRWLWTYARLTGGVTLATIPLVAYYFNQIAWLGLLANLIVVPLAGFVLVPVGLFSAFGLLVFGGESLPLGPLNQTLHDVMIVAVDLLARVPAAEWHVASPAIPVIVVFYLLLVLAFRPRGRTALRWAAALGSGVLLLWWGWSPQGVPDGKTLRVTFLDVGQGDACVIELPDGQTALIDAGAAYETLDMGRAVVAPFLWDRGIRRLNLVVGTHPQLDHIGGLAWIVRSFDVDEYWHNGIARKEPFYQHLRHWIQKKGIRERRTVARAVMLSSKSCRLVALNPPEPDPAQIAQLNLSKGSVLNNLSVVAQLECGPHSFLFAADLESEAMTGLSRNELPLGAKVIKVPHHGAHSSLNRSWIRRVGADIAVISVGHRNRYRHPAPSVIEAYRAQGATVWRTDRDGAVWILADVSSPTIQIHSTRDTLPTAMAMKDFDWRAEFRNLRLIWNRWVTL